MTKVRDKAAKHALDSARFGRILMKSIIPDPNQLDELAAGLDAGWDAEPTENAPSQPPLSAPPPAELAALDADWDDAPKPVAAAEPIAAEPIAAEPIAAKPIAAKPVSSRARETKPAAAKPVAVKPVVLSGPPPVFVSKRERREAERTRRAHQAQQTTASKKERKATRQAEARSVAEQLREAEQRAQAERRARKGAGRKRTPATAQATERAQAPKRVKKRERPEQPVIAPSTDRDSGLPESKKQLTRVGSEGGAKKLLVPILLAILFAVTMGFALSRAR